MKRKALALILCRPQHSKTCTNCRSFPQLNKLRADKEKYHITTALVKDWPPVHVVVLE